MQIDVIGGGLSGLAAAISLKTHDSSLKVIVHEKHKEIAFNHDARKCGEAHSIESFSMQWKPPVEGIASEIHTAYTIIGDKTYCFQRSPGTAWVLDRPGFLLSLKKKAEAKGVILQTNDAIKDVHSLSGEYIIDASGCPSVVRRQLGLPHRSFGVGYQETLVNCSAYEEKTLRIIFDDNNGYFWIFPRHPDKKEVNLGVGYYGMYNLSLRNLLSDFKKSHHITGDIDYVSGGCIPFGLQKPLSYKHIAFVGDAGVGTFPLDGQGIYRALMSGDAAGYYLAKKNIKGYVRKMMLDFIKWDFIGKNFLRYTQVIRHINTNLILPSWDRLQKLSGSLSLDDLEFTTIQ